ncbi:MAG: hypothetical protein ABFS56_13730 [Pseudomonadota bacterium]
MVGSRWDKMLNNVKIFIQVRDCHASTDISYVQDKSWTPISQTGKPICKDNYSPKPFSAALAEKKDDLRYRHGIVILESKRWQRALDRGDKTDTLNSGTPSTQMLHYLSRAEISSERRIQWGIFFDERAALAFILARGAISF